MPTKNANYKAFDKVIKLPMDAGTYTLSFEGFGNIEYAVDSRLADTSASGSTLDESTPSAEITVSEYITFYGDFSTDPVRSFNLLGVSTDNLNLEFGPVLSDSEYLSESVASNSTELENVSANLDGGLNAENFEESFINDLNGGTIPPNDTVTVKKQSVQYVNAINNFAYDSQTSNVGVEITFDNYNDINLMSGKSRSSMDKALVCVKVTQPTGTRAKIRINNTDYSNQNTVIDIGDEVRDNTVLYGEIDLSLYGDLIRMDIAAVASTGTTITVNEIAIFDITDVTDDDEYIVMFEKYISSEYMPLLDLSVNGDLSDYINGNSLINIIRGDSIANGIASKLLSSHPSIFDNQCVGGESVLDTLARFGAIPFKVEPFTIPASGQSADVEIWSSLFEKIEFDGTTALPTYTDGYTSNYSDHINPYGTLECTIAGVDGLFYFERDNGSNYFIRSEAGSEIILTEPVEIVPRNITRRCNLINFMGTNGGWDARFFSDEALGTATETDADFLITVYKRLIDWLKPFSKNYLLLGFYATASVDQKTDENRIAWWDYFENRMTQEFGVNYFSVRQYLRTDFINDLGGSWTSSDIAYILNGQIPYESVTGDSSGSEVHPNDTTYGHIANKILEKMYELGFVEELLTI